MNMLENLTEKQLHKMINHIRTKFYDKTFYPNFPEDPLKAMKEWLHIFETDTWKDGPKIGTMKDDEILKLILGNGIILKDRWNYITIKNFISQFFMRDVKTQTKVFLILDEIDYL